jgi:hypothetical protein
MSLVTLGENEHRLYVTMHQGIVDGVSVFKVLPLELATLYESFSQGRRPSLPELPIQYGDFSCWQRENFGPDIFDRQVTYWRDQLSGELPNLAWPNDGSRPSVQNFRGSILPAVFPTKLSNQLHILCQRESVTLFMVLLAGFVALLHRYTGQDDIVVGTLAPAGRERQEVQGLLGYFLNPVPLRFRLEGSLNVRDLLHQSREIVSGAVANDEIPFHRIIESVTGKAKNALHPLFRVVLSLAPSLPALPSGWRQTFMDVESGGSRWELYLELNERPSGLVSRAQYNPDIYKQQTIVRMLRDMQAVLEAIALCPQQQLSALPLAQIQ